MRPSAMPATGGQQSSYGDIGADWNMGSMTTQPAEQRWGLRPGDD
jgi:hypothetical protein